MNGNNDNNKTKRSASIFGKIAAYITLGAAISTILGINVKEIYDKWKPSSTNSDTGITESTEFSDGHATVTTTEDNELSSVSTESAESSMTSSTEPSIRSRDTYDKEVSAILGNKLLTDEEKNEKLKELAAKYHLQTEQVDVQIVTDDTSGDRKN